MDELLRVERCLHTLQVAPSEIVEPLTYQELLKKLRELKGDVNDQVNRVKAFNFKARQLKESMRKEIPVILKLCHDNPLRHSASVTKETDDSVSLGTPLMATPQISLKKAPTSRGVRFTTPRRATPVSMSKLLLREKFSARCSPVVFSKAQSQRTPVKKTLAFPECTPQLPCRKLPTEKPPALQEPQVRTPKTRTEDSESTANPSEPNGSHVTVPDKTPEMKERVSFFMNPNVGNIHKRYVAIQDQDADESTCLLSTRCASKPSRTPELPLSLQKNSRDAARYRKGLSTPPLPPSSTTKLRFPQHTPEMKTNADKGRETDRTPSPPKSTARKTRVCLESRIENLSIKPQTLGSESEWGPRCGLSQPLEGRAPTLPLTKRDMFVNQTGTPAPPRNLLNALKVKKDDSDPTSAVRADTLEKFALKDNMNRSREKRLPASSDGTPGMSMAHKKKATPKLRIPMGRSSTMPLNTENTTRPLRPSKILRNKTVAL